MEFLFAGILLLWSFIIGFLPMQERRLRKIFAINAVLTAVALAACAAPIMLGTVPAWNMGMFLLDPLRATLLVSLALCWVFIAVGFVLWWGAAFRAGTGSRSVFSLRCITLVGAFVGTLLMLVANVWGLVFLGGVIAYACAVTSVLFQPYDATLNVMHRYVLGIALPGLFLAALLMFEIILGFAPQDNAWLEIISGVVWLVLHPLIFLSALVAALGLFPGFSWSLAGTARLPRGHRAMVRIFLPAALFAHIVPGLIPNQTQFSFVLGGVACFAFFALVDAYTKKESWAELVYFFFITMIAAFLAFGEAGRIPAVMLMSVYPLIMTSIFLSQGGVWWGHCKKGLMARMIGAMPFVSPLFVPAVLGFGYGLQTYPIFALLVLCALTWSAYALIVRFLRTWNESGDPQVSDVWNGKFACFLCVVSVGVGILFFSGDVLRFFVGMV